MANQLVSQSQIQALFSPADIERANRIKRLLPYGEKLTTENALALEAYSRMHGLDPFNGECYFLVREKTNEDGSKSREELGLHPGIKGLRKKAKEQLRQADSQAHYHISYQEGIDPKTLGLAYPDDVLVCVKAVMYDSISTGMYIVNLIQLTHAGYTKEEAQTILGPSPTWSGYGMVKKSETRYIKVPALTLAKKRAEADVTKQRFDLPFCDDTLADDVAPEITSALDNGPSQIAPSDIIDAPQLAKQEAAPEAADEPDYDENRNENVSTPLSIQDAEAVLSSSGTKYGDLTNDELANRMIGINKMLRKAGISEQQLTDYQYKRDAIQTILISRNANHS